MSSLWSWFIIVITVINVVGTVWLLMVTTKGAKPGEDTGHVWDGDLREMNNPLPRWWLWMFYLSVVYAVGYLVAYPGLGNYPGMLGWTQTGQYENELALAEQNYGGMFGRFAAMSTAELIVDPEAMAVGQNLFLNNCTVCHGSDGRGAPGFPNLTDNDWLYGNDPEAIEMTILNGRNGMMPPMGAVGEEGVNELTAYVLGLSGQDTDAGLAARGAARFIACAACHGAEGKGNKLLGAPDLTDDIWLHSGDAAGIRETITNGRSSTMPPQRDILGETKAHLLAAYVLKLGESSE